MEREIGNYSLLISIILKTSKKMIPTEEENLSKDQNNEQNINEENVNSENINSEEINNDEQTIEIENNYTFGWSSYSEITNGRFAMLGFLAIILIELFSHKSFLNWAGIS